MAWWQDLRYAARRLGKDRGYALAVLVMLVLGIAVSVGMFSVLRGVLLRALPYPDAARVVAVGSANPEQGVTAGALTPAEALALESGSEAFASFAHWSWGGFTLRQEGKPREITINAVSAAFFDTLGVAPLLGRTIQPADVSERRPVAVLSYAEWQRLGADPAIVGGSLTSADGEETFEVIGVMPPAFAFPSRTVGLWRPRAPLSAASMGEPVFRHARFVPAIGRLRAEVTPDLAADAIARRAATLREELGLPDGGWRYRAEPLLDGLVGEVRWVLWGCFAIGLCVLAIACANVGILLRARLVARRRELAVSLALGAATGRLRRVLVFEQLLLAGAALVGGLLLARLALDAVRELASGSVPRAGEIALDPLVLIFAALVAGATLLVPMLARLETAGALAGRGGLDGVRRRERRVLPALGLALSTVALVAALALAASLIRLAAVDPGYRADGVVAVQMYRNGDAEEWLRFGPEVREAMAAIPGVEAVALTTAAPLSVVGSFGIDLQVQGRAEPEPYEAGLRRVSPGYLELLGIPVLAGRGILDQDRAGGEKVAVVNATLARRAFGDADPIGQVLGLPIGQGDRVPFRIVGVMADTRNAGLRDAPDPEILVPFVQSPWVGMTFLARSALPAAAVQAAMQEAIWRAAADEAMTRVYTLADDLAAELRPTRFFVATVGAFAFAALLLGAFGVYAVTAFAQRQRIPEFGLKLAVGARPATIVRDLVAEGGHILVAGVALGVVGAAGVLRLLEAQLFGDGGAWTAFALGAIGMTAASLLACLGPALRAARTDPMVALRDD